MNKLQAQVKVLLDLELPSEPDKTELQAVEIQLNKLFLLLCTDQNWDLSEKNYPKLFEMTPDTPIMRENRMKAQKF
jgi:hypothetical protein